MTSTVLNSVGDVPTSTYGSLIEICHSTPGGASVAMQPTTTTPTGGDKRQSLTRKRHANFAVQETKTLLTEIRRSRHVLFDVISPNITPSRKVAVWEEIGLRLAARGWSRRSGKELRRKWENLRYETKIKYMKELRGEQYHLKWSPLNSEVLELMREDTTYDLQSKFQDYKTPHAQHGSAPVNPSVPSSENIAIQPGIKNHHSSAVLYDHAHVTKNSTIDHDQVIDIKSESSVEHLMTHLNPMEPEILNPELRSIEMSRSADSSNGTEPNMFRFNDHSHHHLQNFNSLSMPEQAPQEQQNNIPSSVTTDPDPSPTRYDQAESDTNDTESQLRSEVLRMKYEAYKAKRDYYQAKMKSLKSHS